MNDESTPSSGPGLRLLTEADRAPLIALHDSVMAGLADPTTFRLFGGAQAFFDSHFGQRGVSYGVFAAQALIGYGALTFPAADDSDNYARDLGWEARRAAGVALLSAAMVAPAQRGQGLHSALIRARIAFAAGRGSAELLVRSAPANAGSRRILLAHGFAIVWLGVQAEGSLRHIYWRPTAGRLGHPAYQDDALIWVDPRDIAIQQALLASGRIGVRSRSGDDAIGFAATGTWA